MSADAQKRRVKARRAVRSAERSADWMFIEFACIAGFAGYYYKSWWVFFGVSIALVIVSASKIAPLLFVALSGMWAAMAYYFFSGEGPGFRIPVAAIVFLISMGIHMAGQWWLDD